MPTSLRRFTDRTVIVTGAGSGIGRGVAERFAAEGANVVLTGRTVEKLQAVADGMDTARTLVQACDVRDFTQVEHLVAAAVARFGGIDVLVNNAGIAPKDSIADTGLDDWHDTLQTDLTGVFHGCKAALPQLLARRGCIINMASVSGLGADWALAAYNAAKGGGVNLTRTAGHGLRQPRRARQRGVPVSHAQRNDRGHVQGRALMQRFMERLPLGRRAAEPEDTSWRGDLPRQRRRPLRQRRELAGRWRRYRVERAATDVTDACSQATTVDQPRNNCRQSNS